jgi:endonuclease YncB( thermonuclease family)
MLAVLLLLPGICMGFQGKCVGVKDGDSIMVLRGKDSVEIRLYGIDCPEMGQPFSGRAKKFTSNMVFGKIVEVSPVNMDKLGRTVAWVSVTHVPRPRR